MVFQEVGEDLIHLWRQRDGSPCPPQLPRLGIEFVVVKGVDHRTCLGKV